MAIRISNTPSGVNAFAFPRAGLLRSRGAPCRILSHGEMLAVLDGQKPDLPPEPLLEADVLHGGARGVCPTPGQTSGALTRRRGGPIPSLRSAFSRRRTIFGPVEAEVIVPAEGDAIRRTDADIDTVARQPSDLRRGDTTTPAPRRAPRTTADDFGMSRWWDADVQPGEPQTARSEGDGPFPTDLLRHADLDSLDDARLRYARRMAADAVDHLIALMDAIDARTEDLESEAGYDLPEGDDERCASSEVDDEPWLGSLDQRIDQTAWAGGGDSDREVDDIHNPADLDGLHEQVPPSLAGHMPWGIDAYVG